MKGGVAAMIAAAACARQRTGPAAGSSSPPSSTKSTRASAPTRSSREWRADAAIVTEPTDLRPRDRPQGLRVGRDRDARPRRARQPAGRRPRRDRAHGTRARRARGARPGAARAAAGAVSGHRLAARVDHQRRPRAQQLSGSVRAADGAAHGRGRGRDSVVAARSTRSSRGSGATIREFDAEAAAHGLSARVSPRRRIIALPRALAAALRRQGTRPTPTGMSFWTDAAILAAPAFRRCCSGPAAPASTARRST